FHLLAACVDEQASNLAFIIRLDIDGQQDTGWTTLVRFGELVLTVATLWLFVAQGAHRAGQRAYIRAYTRTANNAYGGRAEGIADDGAYACTDDAQYSGSGQCSRGAAF